MATVKYHDVISISQLQRFLDKLKTNFFNKMVSSDSFQDTLKNYLQNNGTATGEGYALDARYGKTLQDQKADSSHFRIIEYLYSESTEIAANSLGNFTFHVEVSGWVPLGVVGYNTTSWHAFLMTSSIQRNSSDGTIKNIAIAVKNQNNAAINVQPTISVLYVKDTAGIYQDA